ncbi:MAG TPA: hypothetical protein VME45_03135 [Stellaceae bacterium]|nr:hypothetical protein [Stellaceae bacterium]
MSTFIRWAALGVLISTMEIIGASAQAYYPPAPAYAAPARPATALPEVFVPGQGRTAPHYRVPAGYDSDVALHPYTSGLGPCTQAATPDQGCHHPTGHPIPPSHYDRPPFTW